MKQLEQDVYGECQRQQNETEGSRKREVALRRCQGHGSGERSRVVTNVPADDHRRPDLGEYAPECHDNSSEEGEASGTCHGQMSSKGAGTQRQRGTANAGIDTLNSRRRERCCNWRCENDLRDDDGPPRIKQPRSPERSLARKETPDHYADHDSRKRESGIESRDCGAPAPEPCGADYEPRWDADHTSEERGERGNADRERGDVDDIRIAAQDELYATLQPLDQKVQVLPGDRKPHRDQEHGVVRPL